MSTTFRRANERDEINELAADLIAKFHKPLAERGVAIDYVMAIAEKDERTGKTKGAALKKNGVRALGITRKLPLKDRAMGRGDVEIALDCDWWEAAPEKERRALLDHELTHIAVGLDNDDIGRPIIALRYHDYDFGWFRCVAERHGLSSQECQQMALIVEESGQYLLPGITVATERVSRVQRLEVV